MAIIVETLKVIYRNASEEEPDRIPKIPIGPRGETISDRKRLRNNDFVLGVDERQRLLLAYIKGSRTQGFHSDPEDHICRVVGKDRLVAALHGSTKSDGNGSNAIFIYKTHPDDVNTLGGYDGLKLASSTRPWEIGRFAPEQFVTEKLAQRLMHTLDAIRLEIVFAMPSKKIYHIPGDQVKTPGLVPATLGFQMAGG